MKNSRPLLIRSPKILIAGVNRVCDPIAFYILSICSKPLPDTFTHHGLHLCSRLQCHPQVRLVFDT